MNSNKIVNERYLKAGGGMMSESSEAFICFKRGRYICWMYAILIRLTEKTAYFRPVYGYETVRLAPDQIVKITDDDVPSEVVDGVYQGDIVSWKKGNRYGKDKREKNEQ